MTISVDKQHSRRSFVGQQQRMPSGLHLPDRANVLARIGAEYLVRRYDWSRALCIAVATCAVAFCGVSTAQLADDNQSYLDAHSAGPHLPDCSPEAIVSDNASGPIAAHDDAKDPVDSSRGGTPRASCFGSRSTNYSIPDNVCEWDVSSSIAISCAPSGSTVTAMDLHLEVTHTYVGDLEILVCNEASDHCVWLWQQEGGSADDIDQTWYGFTNFSGEEVNQTWRVWARDCASGDTGYIDYWWIDVYYDDNADHCYSCPTYDYTLTPQTYYQTHSDSFQDDGCRWYRVDMDANWTYTFTVCEGGGSYSDDTVFELYNSSCNEVDDDDDTCDTGSQIVYAPSASGYYYLRVRGYGSDAESYTLAYKKAEQVPPPSPQIEHIKLNGSTVQEITITQGDSFDLEVKVRNDGGATPQGLIQASFPDLDGSYNRCQYVSQGSPWNSDLDYSCYDYDGPPIWYQCGTPYQDNAQYVLVDGLDDNWTGGESNTATFHVTPPATFTGSFEVYVKAAMSNSDYTVYWFDPSSGAYQDQQCEYVHVRTVNVNPIHEFLPLDVYVADPADVLTPLASITEGQDVELCLSFSYTGPGATATMRLQLDDLPPIEEELNLSEGSYVYLAASWQATVGSHRLRGWCDFYDDVDETSDTNNYLDENPSFTVALSPDPAVTAIMLNGVPDTEITIGPGEHVDIVITASNTGGDSPYGAIQASFPELTNSGDHALVVQGTPWDGELQYREYYPGGPDPIWYQCSGTPYSDSAQYLLVNAEDEDWTSGESNTATFRFSPDSPGTYQAFIKCALSNENNQWFLDPTSGTQDQQCEFVHVRTIHVTVSPYEVSYGSGISPDHALLYERKRISLTVTNTGDVTIPSLGVGVDIHDSTGQKVESTKTGNVDPETGEIGRIDFQYSPQDLPPGESHTFEANYTFATSVVGDEYEADSYMFKYYAWAGGMPGDEGAESIGLLQEEALTISTAGYSPKQVPILMYHKVAPISQSEYWVTVDDFRAQMALLCGLGYETINFDQLREYIHIGTAPPENPVIITFDDAYQNTYDHAFPILRDYGFTAVVHVPTFYIGTTDEDRKQNTWDQPPEPPTWHMIWSELQELHGAGWSIQNHGHSHAHFLELTPEEKRSEIVTARNLIHARILEQPKYFAYPYGEYDVETKQIVQDEGHLAASAAGGGIEDTSSANLFELQRVYIEANDTLSDFGQKIGEAGLWHPQINISRTEITFDGSSRRRRRAALRQNGDVFASLYMPNQVIVAFPDDTSVRAALGDGAARLKRSDICALSQRFGEWRARRVFHQTTGPLARYVLLTFERNVSVPEVISAFQDCGRATLAEPNHIYRSSRVPTDSSYSLQWGLTRIDAPRAWDVSTGAPNTIIAIVDSGVDYDHEDLEANVWINEDEIADNGEDDDNNGFVDDVRGWDFVSATSNLWPGEDGGPRDNDPMDFHGHGTHCAGIASAVTDVPKSDPNIAGTGWNCSVMVIRAAYKGSDDAKAHFLTTDWAAAVEYAADNGADIISMSFGGYSSNSTGQSAINHALDEGTVLVAAAGNDNTTNQHYPAAYEGVLCVAATDQSDLKASFSNYGNWVDISAPGVSIYSTLFDDTYDHMNGTSMATPFVAGTAGLILSRAPHLLAAEVRAQLLDTTDDIDHLNPDHEGLLGSGRLNAGNALENLPGSFIISNDGPGLLIVNSINQRFNANWLTFTSPSEPAQPPYEILPCGSKGVEVAIEPDLAEPGLNTEVLEIHSNDPDEPIVEVEITLTMPELGTVVIDPEPDHIGAPWTLELPDESEQTGTGEATLSDMPAGEYTLTWNEITGWNDPSPNPTTQTLLPDELITFWGEYTQQTRIISSYVKSCADAPLDGVFVSASDGRDSCETGVDGYCELIVPYGWTGIVTPCKDGWRFEPQSIPYDNITEDQLEQGYAATLIYDIGPPACGDDYVGVGDLSYFAGSWQNPVPPADPRHDFDCDGVVGVGDLSFFASAWLKSAFDPAIGFPPCHVCSTKGKRSDDTPQLELRLVAVKNASGGDFAGELPASQELIRVGQEYYLELWAKDRSAAATGVSGTYVDVEFPGNLVTIQGIYSTTAMGEFASGQVQYNQITDLGGCTLESGVGTENRWVRVATVSVEATAAGTVVYSIQGGSMGSGAFGRGLVRPEQMTLSGVRVQHVSKVQPADRALKL